MKYPYADIAAYGRETPAATALPLAALATGFILAMLDVTIVNVALTDIASTFGASLSGLVWVVDGYTLTFAALMLAGGALADRIGPRAAYLSGLAIFTLASVACGLAWDTASLVGARLVQGVGAALGAESSHAVFLVLLTAGNLGVAIAIPALTATVMRAGGQDHANSASAVLNANRQIGTLVGIAAMGSVLHALPGWGTGLRVALALIALGYAAAWTIALRGLRSDGRPTPAEAAPGRP
ncbi:MFS transporter [uncultured Pigmentiphaga sp.]|uniref:MFS transporter n=2 Tax=Pigmentiphaga TaxID=152267 RepID=UPI00260DA610|nr:MFS transporter [uncultured Pigmentiphaga sp.]